MESNRELPGRVLSSSLGLKMTLRLSVDTLRGKAHYSATITRSPNSDCSCGKLIRSVVGFALCRYQQQ